MQGFEELFYLPLLILDIYRWLSSEKKRWECYLILLPFIYRSEWVIYD